MKSKETYMIQETVVRKKNGDTKYNHRNKKMKQNKTTQGTINEKNNKIPCNVDSLKMPYGKVSHQWKTD